jgi:hypothetical protein
MHFFTNGKKIHVNETALKFVGKFRLQKMCSETSPLIYGL